MAKFIIDTEIGTCVPYIENDPYTLADSMKPYRGVTEYNGIVADIQKWYYGSLVKASWCATGVSYFADLIGIADQIGKNENVLYMMRECEKQKSGGVFYDKKSIPTRIKKGDVLFMLWDGEEMTSVSNKHVTVAEYDSTGNTVFCIGCNQKDKICTLEYERKYIYGLFRPKYR